MVETRSQKKVGSYSNSHCWKTSKYVRDVGRQSYAKFTLMLEVKGWHEVFWCVFEIIQNEVQQRWVSVVWTRRRMKIVQFTPDVTRINDKHTKSMFVHRWTQANRVVQQTTIHKDYFPNLRIDWLKTFDINLQSERSLNSNEHITAHLCNNTKIAQSCATVRHQSSTKKWNTKLMQHNH